jgi:hypothetical protein
MFTTVTYFGHVLCTGDLPVVSIGYTYISTFGGTVESYGNTFIAPLDSPGNSQGSAYPVTYGSNQRLDFVVDEDAPSNTAWTSYPAAYCVVKPTPNNLQCDFDLIKNIVNTGGYGPAQAPVEVTATVTSP